MVDSAPRPQPLFTVRGQVRVVVHAHGQVEGLFHPVLQTHTVHALEVLGRDDHPLERVQGTGGADAHSGNVRHVGPAIPGGFPHACHDALNHGIAAQVEPRVTPGATQDPAVS